MKKVLIVNNNLHIGGVQQALVDLLNCIHDRYDVTLALFYPHGALLGRVPPNVKILPVRSGYRFLGMTRYDVEKKPLLRLQRSFYAAVCRLFGRKWAVRLMALGQKRLEGFDVAISYLHDAGEKTFYGGCNDFVLRHTGAKEKIAFLHCDYVGCGANTPQNQARYEAFDRIAACSEGCRAAFLQAVPNLTKKTVVVSNCQDYNGIWYRSLKKPEKFPGKQINFLTVARFGREKGVGRGIEAVARLDPAKTPYHYYVIGDGAERPGIEALIRKYHLEDTVTLLGEQTEPYGYMRAADLLLIPSVTEAAPLVIGEAACLGTPVLSTETSSAAEMIEATGFGWVCGNSVEAMACMLSELLNDPERLSKKRQDLQALNINNDNAVKQFEALIG